MYDTCIFDLYGTLVDIRTDESAPGLWEKLALFYSYCGASWQPEELRNACERLTLSMSEGRRGLRRDSHEAFPEIRKATRYNRCASRLYISSMAS